MRFLKQSTSVDVPIGPFLDATDGVTAESGLTITQHDVVLKKNGANWAHKNAAQTLSHEWCGYYEVTLDTTDTNTLGLLRLTVAESGAMPVFEDFIVVPANTYDSFVGGTDIFDVSVTQLLGGTLATPAVTGVIKADVTHFAGTATTASAGRPEVNTTHVAGTSQSAGDIIGDTNDIQARLPAALVSGRIDASVGAMASDTITAAAVASGAIDADAIASNAITSAKIASGALTSTALATSALVAIADCIVAHQVEIQGQYSLQQALSIMLAVLSGVTSSNGATISTPNGSATRVTATIDANNNRTAMTLNPSA